MPGERKGDFYRTSGFDWVLIGIILIFCAASTLWITYKSPQQSSKEKTLLVYRDKALLEEAGLNEDKIISILNGKIQVEIKGKRARVLSSDCPQHICMNTGWIQHNGQAIVCVPNRVLIEIKSKGPEFLDAVAY